MSTSYLGRPNHGKILRHLRTVFPTRRARSLMPQYGEHLGLLLVEYARLQTCRPDNVSQWMEVGDLGPLVKALARGKGVVIVTAHVGNWEFSGQALAINGIPLHALYQPLDNIHFERELLRLRRRNGLTVYPKRGGLRTALRILKSGGAVSLQIDEDAEREGVFVPFLGTLASTFPSAARLARRTGAAIVPVTTYRQRSRTKHRLIVWPEIEQLRTDDEERDVLLTVRRCIRVVERAILNTPAQWIWLHPRWRTRPGERETGSWRRAAEFEDNDRHPVEGEHEADQSGN